MSCDRYWREGIVLVEQGLPDLHRETCEDCKRAHAARDELVRALPSVGPASTGDPSWQARVWAQIAREKTSTVSRRAWFLGGAAVAAVVMILVVFGWGRWRTPERERELYATAFEIKKGATVKRADTAVGDYARVQLHPSDELRVYRLGELMFRCSDMIAAPGCSHDTRGSVGMYELATAGEYTIVIVTKPTVEPLGSLDRDLAAIVTAGGKYRIMRELSVR